LGFKKIKQSLIVGIALLVSFLINLPRVLALFNIVDELGTSFTHPSVKDIIVRFIFLSMFSWIVLQYYTNWKFIFSKLSKYIVAVINVVLSVVVILYGVKAFISIYQFYVDTILTSQEVSLLYFVYIVVLIILVFISGILRYQVIHQEELVEKELLKQQSLKNELEALKNQINPHFLFNSLNSLNSLVRGNKEATTFVNKLSFMYRYILQSGSEDLVTLEEELKFLESYIYLIKTRYRNRFDIQINIDDEVLNGKIPSLALQLLVENAVKHNEISESNPLLVKVYYEDGNLIVENKIKPRKTFVDSTGNGLVNLNKRYVLLKKRNISINNDNKVFRVKLPTI
jgi:sensor histidine kinase YesM